MQASVQAGVAKLMVWDSHTNGVCGQTTREPACMTSGPVGGHRLLSNICQCGAASGHALTGTQVAFLVR
jgi:hypothetical protein